MLGARSHRPIRYASAIHGAIVLPTQPGAGPEMLKSDLSRSPESTEAILALRIRASAEALSPIFSARTRAQCEPQTLAKLTPPGGVGSFASFRVSGAQPASLCGPSPSPNGLMPPHPID